MRRDTLCVSNENKAKQKTPSGLKHNREFLWSAGLVEKPWGIDKIEEIVLSRSSVTHAAS